MASTRTPRRAQIDSFFTCQHPDQFRIDWRGFYQRAEARTDEVRVAWQHELDIAYGPSEYHRLDLYLPVRAGSSTPPPTTQWPVLMFLHGGGFREGDPTLYGYLAEPYLERGIAFASLGYRLTPESFLPATFDDVEDALGWCARNLPSRGIDVDRLALAGHSAGAILSAHLAVRGDWQSAQSVPADMIKIAIPISGVYDFTDPAERREFFTEDADRAAASPLLRVSTAPRPLLVAYGSDENQPAYAEDSRRLVQAARAAGGDAEVLELAGMTHADTADALGAADSPLFLAIMQMFERLGLAGMERVA
jgi:acetyl esterase/lipase